MTHRQEEPRHYSEEEERAPSISFRDNRTDESPRPHPNVWIAGLTQRRDHTRRCVLSTLSRFQRNRIISRDNGSNFQVTLRITNKGFLVGASLTPGSKPLEPTGVGSPSCISESEKQDSPFKSFFLVEKKGLSIFLLIHTKNL
jgi:hypothetical protein